MVKDVPITAEKIGNIVRVNAAGADVRIRIMLPDGSIGFSTTVRPADSFTLNLSEEDGVKGQIQALSNRFGWVGVLNL